ncbi:class I SAM-dependent DNA methyltransferase [Sulfitobacter delicatus]|uniref:Methyltransferase domain-containing protein n=1 Tax=Sulfitobacter delicatus TaxID=218672 RepID=A0A1G7SFT4_9RHOB|nr:class I SAM-dependent methyltransferase [Sulfitobacter delicatus]SDG21070.1 Methyltransferase domain-containing protein [Sulfitobacter delicatus]
MTERYIDRAYAARDPEEIREIYEGWAATYESDITAQGYATPERGAETLAQFMADKDAPILDMGCGTGLSGVALKAAGFTTIDGADTSAAMLQEAGKKSIYRNLLQVEPDEDLPFRAGNYAAITAIGVIGPGAAPISLFDALMHKLTKGGKLLFSLNDHAMVDSGTLGMIHEWTDCGAALLLSSEDGPHLPGMDLNATVYLIEKN